MSDARNGEFHKTVCILCSANCGVEIRLDGRRFTRVRGNKAHVSSKGYTCEKALRLDHYQNAAGRLTAPSEFDQADPGGPRRRERTQAGLNTCLSRHPRVRTACPVSWPGAPC